MLEIGNVADQTFLGNPNKTDTNNGTLWMGPGNYSLIYGTPDPTKQNRFYTNADGTYPISNFYFGATLPA